MPYPIGCKHKMNYNNNNIRLQQACRKYAIRTMTLPESHPIRLRSSTSFPPEFPSGIDVDLRQSDWDTADTKYSQLWRIHHTTADFTPSSTRLEQLDRQPPSQNPVFNITQQPHHQLTPKIRSNIFNTPSHPY